MRRVCGRGRVCVCGRGSCVVRGPWSILYSHVSKRGVFVPKGLMVRAWSVVSGRVCGRVRVRGLWAWSCVWSCAGPWSLGVVVYVLYCAGGLF